MKEPTDKTFSKDVAQHAMTVLIDQGEHRHLHFARRNTSDMNFHITTWPGYLCISGDMGCYVFARLRDMFEFFRGDRINPGYWSEKVQAQERHRGVKEYDRDLLIKVVEDYIADWPAEVKEAAREAVNDSDNEYVAHVALVDFRHKHDDDWVYRFTDTFEWDLTSYTYQYLWCCRAIVWAIQQYDSSKNR